MRSLKNRAKFYLGLFGRALSDESGRQIGIVREIDRLREQIRSRTPENIALRGARVYSQCDEDGIIEAIFETLGGPGSFIEIGCGNGLENNTHALLLKGWKGVWVDGSKHGIEYITSALGGSQFPRLLVDCQFVDAHNVAALFRRYAGVLGTHKPDFLSLDIDGNDLHVLNAVLETVSPKVICVEYNAKFPPPMRLGIEYDPQHVWSGDDYHGASLAAFVAALKERYSLLTCTVAGTNAFFVRADQRDRFRIYPAEDLYQPPRYHLTNLAAGHRASLRWLRNSLAS